jgi:hypothetical protein
VVGKGVVDVVVGSSVVVALVVVVVDVVVRESIVSMLPVF